MPLRRLGVAILVSVLLMLVVASLSYGTSEMLYKKAKEDVIEIIRNADPDIVGYFYTSKDLKNASHVWIFGIYLTFPIMHPADEYLGALYEAKIGNMSAYLYMTYSPRIVEGLEPGGYYLIGNPEEIAENVEITLIWDVNSTTLAKNISLENYPKNYADDYILNNITASYGLPIILLPIPPNDRTSLLRIMYNLAEQNIAPEVLVLEVSLDNVLDFPGILSSDGVDSYAWHLEIVAKEYGMRDYYPGLFLSKKIFVEHPIENFNVESTVSGSIRKEEGHYRTLLMVSGVLLVIIAIGGSFGLRRILSSLSEEHLIAYFLATLILLVLISIYTIGPVGYKILSKMEEFFGSTVTIYEALVEAAVIIAAYGALTILLFERKMSKRVHVK